MCLKRKFTIDILFFVFYLLNWLDFWAEVHPVKEVNFFSKTGLVKKKFCGFFIFFPLDWMDFWAEVHLVQEEKFLVPERTFKTELLYFTVSFASWTGWTFEAEVHVVQEANFIDFG